MTDSDIIREKIGIGEVLAQLAEEATELAQAALKYRRVITGINPTPVSKEEALEHLREEIADVDLCLVIAGDLCEEADNELFRMEAKQARWIERLQAAQPPAEAKPPDCGRKCVTDGDVCPRLRPDFGCEYDGEEAKA